LILAFAGTKLEPAAASQQQQLPPETPVHLLHFLVATFTGKRLLPHPLVPLVMNDEVREVVAGCTLA
jgi:hypothetical protein